jgi:hypothetical protein
MIQFFQRQRMLARRLGAVGGSLNCTRGVRSSIWKDAKHHTNVASWPLAEHGFPSDGGKRSVVLAGLSVIITEEISSLSLVIEDRHVRAARLTLVPVIVRWLDWRAAAGQQLAWDRLVYREVFLELMQRNLAGPKPSKSKQMHRQPKPTSSLLCALLGFTQRFSGLRNPPTGRSTFGCRMPLANLFAIREKLIVQLVNLASFIGRDILPTYNRTLHAPAIGNDVPVKKEQAFRSAGCPTARRPLRTSNLDVLKVIKHSTGTAL